MFRLKNLMAFFLAFFLATANGFAGLYEQEDLDAGYAYLNELRVRAGMTEFFQNPLLETAAFNHADYLLANNAGGHYEAEGDTGFTGVFPKDRTAAAGYRSLVVGENVSTGNKDSRDSIDNLMGAIYHRFGFLGFVDNEIGMGTARASLDDPGSYVYNMGNSDLNLLCQGPAFSGTGRYYYGVCHPDIHIDAVAYENAQLDARNNNPDIVVWPARGDTDVPPVFFEETPDPLPDYSVSGYPVSIQFNPSVFSEGVQVDEFELFREKDNVKITLTRLLSKDNDPNSRFTALQYSLFPLERLDWDTTYRVEAAYTHESIPNTLSWNFKTRKLSVPLYTVEDFDEPLFVPASFTDFAVYVPPTTRYPTIGGVRYNWTGGMGVGFSLEDQNTLLVNLTGNVDVGNEVRVTLQDGREFLIRMGEAEPAADTCEVASLSSGLALQIPILSYTFSESQAPLFMRATLLYVGGDRFELVGYETVAAPSQECRASTLSTDLEIHIPELQYSPSTGESMEFWLDLEYVGGMLFRISRYGENRR